jgi:hypothetical protein
LYTAAHNFIQFLFELYGRNISELATVTTWIGGCGPRKEVGGGRMAAVETLLLHPEEAHRLLQVTQLEYAGFSREVGSRG